MFSDDELLLIYGAVACVIVKRRKRQLKRNQWTKDWLLNRAQYSHVNLLKELRFHPKDWHNYLRMNEETFFSEMMNFHHAISSNFWLELTSFEQTFAYTQSIRLVSSACSHRIDKPI
ncbi:hypothetical protein J6590_040677 [Homalodisca vitripennis]|nr:hypothetical protein J6590_040677 [Homalodisca vitripennis]